MLDWLAAPVDPIRPHDVAGLIAWHARLMILGWGLLLPAGILVARFLKVTPNQDWPRVLDNKFWWRLHLSLQYSGSLCVAAALALIALYGPGARGLHALLGWSVIALTLTQLVSGLLRGTKGGPTAPGPDGSLAGDHYSMTPRRRAFERAHKFLGHLAFLLSVAAIATGLWLANAPNWMWLVIVAWWLFIFAVGVVLQFRGYAVDTYQAIWGPDPRHPGNNVPPIGWGVARREPKSKP